MASLRFVHAADLHLDSPFVGLKAAVPQRVEQKLLSATFEAYDSIIDLCLQENVSALLVAGDVYDGADRSLRAQLRFVDGLRRLDAAGISSFVCHGNHDPLSGWQARLDFPGRSHQFGTEVESVPLDPENPDLATVVGISYGQRDVVENLVPRFASAARRGFSIGLLHCNAGGDPDHEQYAACSVGDLIDSGFDYWALGHVHRSQILKSQSPAIVYPGNSQGRHFKEAGARGAYLVSVDGEGRIECQFHETSVLRWETVDVSISDLETVHSLLERAATAIAEVMRLAGGRDLILRLQLKGRGRLHGECRRPGFGEEFLDRLNDDFSSRAPFAWIGQLELDTADEFDRDTQRDAGDFLGELLRLIDSMRAEPRNLGELTGTLDELYRSPRLARFLETAPNEAELLELLEEAEAVCLEALS